MAHLERMLDRNLNPREQRLLVETFRVSHARPTGAAVRAASCRKPFNNAAMIRCPLEK